MLGISESTVCYAQLLSVKRCHRPLCFAVVAFLTKQFQDRAVDGVGQLNIRVLHVLYTVTTFKVDLWENSLDCISDVGQFVDYICMWDKITMQNTDGSVANSI